MGRFEGARVYEEEAGAEKEPTLDELISAATMPQELYAALRSVEKVFGSPNAVGKRTEYKTEELIKGIMLVLEGNFPIDQITRAHGIREKVREFLHTI